MRISHGAVPAFSLSNSLRNWRSRPLAWLFQWCIQSRQERYVVIRSGYIMNWSVKEHQERGSDLISSGYVSRLSSQLEMRSERHSFLHWISLMWKFQDVKFIQKSSVLLCSVRCLVPSERKAPLAPNHEIQESARSSSFHSLLGLLRLQLDLRCGAIRPSARLDRGIAYERCFWSIWDYLSSTIDQVIQYSLVARCLWNYYSRSV